VTTTLPLTIVTDPEDEGAASVFVDVECDGRMLPFLLDTGAAHSRTSAGRRRGSAANPPTAAAASRGALGGRPTSHARTVIDALVWGTGAEPVTLHGVEMESTEEDAPGPAHVLGLDVLARHRLDLFYSTARLTVDAPERPTPSAHLVLSSHGHPHIELEWDGVRVRALLDTGASVTVVDNDFASRHRHLLARRGVHDGTDDYGASARTPMAMLAGPRVGGRSFRPSMAAIAPIRGIQPEGDPDFDVILGHPLLSQADWSLDLPGRRWSFLDELDADRSLIE